MVMVLVSLVLMLFSSSIQVTFQNLVPSVVKLKFTEVAVLFGLATLALVTVPFIVRLQLKLDVVSSVAVQLNSVSPFKGDIVSLAGAFKTIAGGLIIVIVLVSV